MRERPMRKFHASLLTRRAYPPGPSPSLSPEYGERGRATGAVPMSPKSVSRRTLLRGAGVALALPLLESMAPSRAAALAIAAGGPAVAQQKRRMVAICTNLGIHTPYL